MPEPRYPQKGSRGSRPQGSAGGISWRFPLPKEVADGAQGLSTCLNPGLWLDRFTEWEELDRFTEWEEQRGEIKRAGASDKRQKVPKSFNIPELFQILSAYRNRWDRMLDAYKAQGYTVQRFTLRAASRVVVGLGAESVLETSIRLHRIYGFPIIPGSALKGLARAYAELVEGRNEEDSLFADVFGKSPPEAQAGEVIFFDAIPANPDTLKLELDVMNPHYAPYYQGTQPPADYHSPVPIFFLTIGPGSELLFAVASQNADLATKAKEWLKKALEEMGVGAKTVAGYGLWTE
jgi:CRISPR-associated protein Cmr6